MGARYFAPHADSFILIDHTFKFSQLAGIILQLSHKSTEKMNPRYL